MLPTFAEHGVDVPPKTRRADGVRKFSLRPVGYVSGEGVPPPLGVPNHPAVRQMGRKLSSVVTSACNARIRSAISSRTSSSSRSADDLDREPVWGDSPQSSTEHALQFTLRQSSMIRT